MSAGNLHRIHRQTLELAFEGLNPATAQAAATRALRSQAYLTELEDLLDRIASADRLVPMARLELDLGEVSVAGLPAALLEALEETLAGETLTARAPAPPSAGATGRPEAQSTRTTHPPQTRPGGATQPSAADGRARAILIYLVCGRLPWWFAPTGDDWLVPCLHEISPATLRPLLTASAAARSRLVQRLSDGDLAELFARVTSIGGADKVVASITSCCSADTAEVRGRCWEALLLEAEPAGASRGPVLLQRLAAVMRNATGGTPSTGGAAAAAASPLRDVAGESTPIKPSTSRPVAAETEAPHAFPRDLTASWPEPWRGWAADLSRARAASAQGQPGPAQHADSAPRRPSTPFDGAREASADSEPASAYRNELREAEAVTGVRITGVGCVLLHPFLLELFHSNGWWDDDWTREDAQARAVDSLAYLAFGDAEVPEHDLVLQKQLVGMAWETPLTVGPLAPPVRERCDALLAAVRGHWAAVKSADDDWMRQQFYAREGQLEAVDDGYRCCVESKAQDVLLGKLPWSYGVIRLPWMAQMIFVQWG